MAAAKKQPKKTKIKILLPVSGTYRLSFDVGDIVELPTNQALELIDSKHAEKAK